LTVSHFHIITSENQVPTPSHQSQPPFIPHIAKTSARNPYHTDPRFQAAFVDKWSMTLDNFVLIANRIFRIRYILGLGKPRLADTMSRNLSGHLSPEAACGISKEFFSPQPL
jgi:hypothetical protein